MRTNEEKMSKERDNSLNARKARLIEPIKKKIPEKNLSNEKEKKEDQD